MPDIKKVVLAVSGLHCQACEMLIEDELKSISKVVSVSASQSKSLVEITYQEEPNLDQIKKTIAQLGYKVNDKKEGEISGPVRLKDYLNIFLIFAVILGLYFLLKKLAWFDWDLNAKNLTWPLVILVGVLAGFSSCMSLVGGLVLGIAANYTKNHPVQNFWSKFKPHLLFNVGRISGYFVLGGALGLLGEAFQLSITAISVITLLAALIMIFMGLKMTGLFPALHKVSLTLPKNISRIFSVNKKSDRISWPQILSAGALTFFLPCGFTQAMQVYAIASASFLGGGLIMALFALGTTPGLLTLGGLVALFKGRWLKVFYKIVSVLLIIFGIINIINVARLTGLGAINLNDSKKIVSIDPNVKIENGIQIVRMEENNRGYTPSSFTLIKGVPVRWIITAKAPYSCASALVVKNLKIRKMLAPGENIVEFTPQTVGQIKFSCSMGMYTGYFNVVEK